MSDNRYIQLKRRYIDEDPKGRHTFIEADTFGILIEEESHIDTVFYISPRQKERLQSLFRSAKELGKSLALVAGYPCVLSQSDFIQKKPAIYVPPWEVI